MSSRLIRSHEVAEHCQPWHAPEVSGPTLRGGATDADDLRSARQKAWQEGFEQGRAAGLEAARQDATSRARALEQALDALSRPFEALDQQFHAEVLELVKAVTRQVLRREIRIDPTHVIGVVRDGLAALPMSASEVAVRMHPDDAAVVREVLAPDNTGRSWRIETDPLMERGSCVVVTAQSQVDGRLETRLARTIATMFHDERRDARQNDSESPGPEPRQ